jgi:hypothetical protein
MKTQALNGQFDTLLATEKRGRSYRFNAGSGLQVLLLILAAILPAAVVSVITIWAISSGATAFVAAFYWASGFIFLALMVDSEGKYRTVLAGTGLGLMTMAWMSSRVAPEFGVIAGFVLAAWVAAPVVRCLALRVAD